MNMHRTMAIATHPPTAAPMASGAGCRVKEEFLMLQIVWLLIIAMLAAVVFLFWDWVPYLVSGSLMLAFLGWVIVSTLWPSSPDRRCPNCQADGLVKIRRGQPGVVCELCGFRDETMHVAYLDDW